MKTGRFAGSLLVLLLAFAGAADAGSPQTRKPFDETEFNRFMTDYPSVSQWLTEKGRHRGGVNSPWMLSGMRYDRDFIKYLQEKGWDSERFFYLLDHVNLGLLTSQSEARQEAAMARMEQNRGKMQAQMADEQKKWQGQAEEQSRSSLETARAQWAAQRERLSNDPNIPPPQKQRMLAQMDRSQPATPETPEAQQARMRKQQQEWLAAQKRQIVNNPAIPLPQKQEMIAQMDRSMVTASAAPGPAQNVAVPSPADRHAQMQARQKQWMEARMQEVRNNPMIPPAQKQQTLDQMQRSLDSIQATDQRGPESQGLLPTQESDLIKNHRQKLTEMFFPEM